MIHRNLDHADDAPVTELGTAGLDNLLDRGDLGGWAPLAAAVAHDPFGEVAARVLQVVDAHAMYGTSRLWRTWIERLRDRQRGVVIQESPPVLRLRDLRRRVGLTQRQVATRLGATQPDVSRLEQRSDVKVSTLRAYVEATGGTLRMIRTGDDGDVQIDVAGDREGT